MIGQNALDLLGHGAVAGAEAGLDVSEGHTLLGAHECARQRRVYIADYDDPIGAMFPEPGSKASITWAVCSAWCRSRR